MINSKLVPFNGGVEDLISKLMSDETVLVSETGFKDDTLYEIDKNTPIVVLMRFLTKKMIYIMSEYCWETHVNQGSMILCKVWDNNPFHWRVAIINRIADDDEDDPYRYKSVNGFYKNATPLPYKEVEGLLWTGGGFNEKRTN